MSRVNGVHVMIFESYQSVPKTYMWLLNKNHLIEKILISNDDMTFHREMNAFVP